MFAALLDDDRGGRFRMVGFVAPRDPLWLSTLDATNDEPVTDSLVYRSPAPTTSPWPAR